jgi:N-acetylmuramoyl-L-alanine amidase
VDYAQAESLSPLATQPDWNKLAAFQETVTHDDFLFLLQNTYAPGSNADPWIEVKADRAVIKTSGKDFELRFAPDRASRRPVPRYWAPLLPRPGRTSNPLAGVTVAIDPGHLGGQWAKMEERWFQLNSASPVMEGNLTLRVAQVLAPRLRALGADVRLVRNKLEPVALLRPEQLLAAALNQRPELKSLTESSRSSEVQAAQSLLSRESEKLFYRVAEIRERARVVNEEIRPDLVLCLHFNAEPWGDPQHPALTEANHLHLIINGAYARSELQNADVRFAMLIKLLNRSHDVELSVSQAVAAALARTTGLPPYQYNAPNGIVADPSGYLWARNLLANRLYQCPVIYIECYVMNSRSFFQRFVAGEYPGLREFDGVLRPNIFQEYANGIVEGLKSIRTDEPMNRRTDER